MHFKKTFIALVAFFCSNNLAFANEIHEYSLLEGESLFLFKPKETNPEKWESLNTEIADVKNGIIYSKKEGTALINKYIILDEDTKKETFKINVKGPAPIRYKAYTACGNNVKVFLTTNKNTKDVNVTVNLNGKEYNTFKKNKSEDGNTLFWEILVNIKDANSGPFNAKIITKSNENKTHTEHISGNYVSGKDLNTPSILKRAISEKGAEFIKNWEGFVPKIEEDKLAHFIYNIGCGDVIHYADTFYNNITEKQSYVSLLNKLNIGNNSHNIYVRNVNDFIISNKIKCTQNQFDALVSFSYNLGTGWTKNSELKNIIFESKDPKDGGINLLYINKEKFTEEFLKYHHVINTTQDGQKDKRCIPGLLFRRVSELDIFFYGTYCKETGKLNVHNYKIPECIKDVLNAPVK